MIIWLASYPRSGNTLLRSIFQKTMGLCSYADDLGVNELGLTEVAKAEFGDQPIEMSWDDFYKKASDSPDIHLVKTHLPPRDLQPVIYVVRDGRQSVVSYLNYHMQFHKGHSTGLMELILGDDYYGGWSTHYADWFSSSDRKMLTLRYENLVNASPETIEKIAKFVGYQRNVAGWSNAFERLHGQNPSFYRAGRFDWQKGNDWTDFIDSVFFFLHGDLMLRLGYVNTEYVEHALSRLSPELKQLIKLTCHILEQKQVVTHECSERQKVIDGLVETCKERLDVIKRLT